MSVMTSPLVLKARSLARELGLGNLMMRRQRAEGYERALTQAMQRALAQGDCAWDVGANVGFYSVKFAEWAGPEGKVYAFEPDLDTLADLRAGIASYANITVVPIGLSEKTATLPFRRLDDHGARSRIVAGEAATAKIEVRDGDSLITDGTVATPNFLKIDIEGHELDVIRGLGQTLGNVTLRNVFIEMHFAIFTERGQTDAPSAIERLLKGSGFRMRWIDQSHLHAFRV